MNMCACIWTVAAIPCLGVGAFACGHGAPPYRSPVPSQCVSVCVRRPSITVTAWFVFTQWCGVYLWSHGRRVGGRGKKVRWGEIETARGCDIKISSRWWMSTSATLARTTKRQLCNGRQVISRTVYSWGGVGVSGTYLWVNVCRVYDLQGNELWSRSVTEDDCAACPSWKMGLHLLRLHSFQLTVHIKHIYIRIKMELDPGKRCNMLDNVSAFSHQKMFNSDCKWVNGPKQTSKKVGLMNLN